MEDKTLRLATAIRTALRDNMVNGYTCLAPRKTENAITMTVKDATSEYTYTVTVKEDKP